MNTGCHRLNAADINDEALLLPALDLINTKLLSVDSSVDRPLLAYWEIIKRGPHMKKKLASLILQY